MAGIIGGMAFSFLYLIVRALFGALARSRRGLHVKDVELLVLRHELGPTGRKMFDPNESLPAEYGSVKTAILGDRVKGHYRKRCVVAHEDDVDSMLLHGAAQARLRNF